MSDKANIFINTLLGVFKTAENRLLEQGLEKKSVENAMKELKGSVAGISSSKEFRKSTCLSQILRWKTFSNPSTYGSAMV